MSVSLEEYSRVERELHKFKCAEREVSDAYLRLRNLIPGALDTPFAPTPAQIWAITEEALKKAQSAQAVIVVCCNDFPDAVFSGQDAAEQYAQSKVRENRGCVPRRFYHLHSFVVDAKK